MDQILRIIRKLIKYALLFCGVVFFIPWLYFVPGLHTFFPENFEEVGWLFSLMAMAAVFWLLIGYIALEFLVKIIRFIIRYRKGDAGSYDKAN